MRPPVLDLGCGDGLFASIFYERPAAVGLDPDRRALGHARPHYRSIVNGDAAAMPFRNGAFGTVLSNSVLEHVTNVAGVLQEARRVLDPDGRLVITVPTPAYQHGLLYSRLLRAVGLPWAARAYERFVNRVFHHRTVLSVAGWVAAVEAAGFSVETTRGYLSPFVIALNDALYPSAAVARLMGSRRDGYFLLHPVRLSTAPLLATVLRGVYRGGERGEGYVLVVARPSDSRRPASAVREEDHESREA